MAQPRPRPPVHRQRGKSPFSAATTLGILAVLAAIAVIVWRAPSPRQTAPPVAAPAPGQRAPTHTPVPLAPAATTGPSPVVIEHRTVVVPWDTASATPTATPTLTVTPSPVPTPTPRPSECVDIRWSASTVGARFGEILVDINAANRCGRDFDAMQVWFLVAGYRHGELVQSVRGHLFDPLRSGDDGRATVALPGSLDWYDRVEVTVLDPSAL